MKFVDTVEPFLQHDEETWTHVLACRRAIAERFELHALENLEMADFSLIASKEDSACIMGWEVRQLEHAFNLCLVQYSFTSRHHHRHTTISTDLYFFGHLFLKKDYDIAYIRPETLGDKISEFFEPVEIDFRTHPEFCKRYYVLAENRDRFQQVLTNEFLDFTGSVNGLELEFRNQQCLFRLPKAIDEKESLELCKIGLALDRILNKKI